MTDDSGRVRSIAWRDLFPWLMIFRTFGASITLPALFLAAVGALLTPVGWRTGQWLFIPKQDDDAKQTALADDDAAMMADREEMEVLAASGADFAFQQIVARNGRWAWEAVDSPVKLLSGQGMRKPKPSLKGSGISQQFHAFVSPYVQLSRTDLTAGRTAYFLFGGLWTLLVWAFFGGAISRLAVMQLGCEQRIGMREALTHARRKALQYFLAPLGPLLLVVLIAAPMALLGLLMKLDFGVVVAGIFWLLVLVGGFMATVLLLGLFFGWPLMWGTISAEESEAFEALSRCYAYTFQRPLHYLFYGLVAAAFGTLVFMLVFWFASTVVYMGQWGVAWGMGAERLVEVNTVGEDSGGLLWTGAGIIEVFNGVIWTVANGFGYSFFWCVAAAVFLLLRRDVDQTEFDEIHVDEEEERYGLPPLKTDQEGVPGLADEPEDATDDGQENEAE